MQERVKARDLFGHDYVLVRLGQAVAWCRARADLSNPRGCLRTEQLRPWTFETDRATVVSQLCVKRARLDPEVGKAPAVADQSGLAGGDLLLYLPDQQLADGAAEYASLGFFDLDNTPPWDSWVALVRDPQADLSDRDQLVCYVPAELRAVVQRGIDVNPERCILWLRERPIRSEPLVS
jgi:hypothetical protein